MGMLLTDAQRKWVDILKESARKKPQDHSIRPKVRHLFEQGVVLCGISIESAAKAA